MMKYLPIEGLLNIVWILRNNIELDHERQTRETSS